MNTNKPAAAPTPVEPEDYHWTGYEGATIHSMFTRPNGSTVLVIADGRGVTFEGDPSSYSSYGSLRPAAPAESQGVERAQPVEGPREDEMISDERRDIEAVDRFALAMKEKLSDSRAKGRYGWHDPEVCSRGYLSDELREHLDTGDPVDVANFAMFLHQRGECIEAAPVEGVERVTDDAPARVEPEPDWKRYEFIDRKDCRCPCHSEMLPAKHIIPCCQERPDAQPAKHTDDRTAETIPDEEWSRPCPPYLIRQVAGGTHSNNRETAELIARRLANDLLRAETRIEVLEAALLEIEQKTIDHVAVRIARAALAAPSGDTAKEKA